jgi:hypothetical protein
MRAAQIGAKFLARTKAEEGLSHRRDVVTAFDLIDLREGRIVEFHYAGKAWQRN